MIDRKTKRLSNPVIDTKMTDNFSKWAMKMQLLIPPSKKQRPTEYHYSSEEEDDDDEDETRKRLNRRGVYLGYPPSPLQLPSPPLSPIPDDSPKDASQRWSLFCSTHEKLRRNKLPLSEIVHLRRMLLVLKQQSNGQLNDNIHPNSFLVSNNNHSMLPNNCYMTPTMMYSPSPVFYHPSPRRLPPMKYHDDDDDVPLVSLINSNQPTTTTTTNFYQPQIYPPYILQQPRHYYYRH